MRRIISTDEAPAAVGAYSQGTSVDNLVFTAGQIALTPEGEDRTDEPPAAQAELCLENLTAVLEEAGSSLGQVLKTTIYLADIDDYEAINEVYSGYFEEEPPARSAFAVDALPKGAAVEIEAIATTD